MAKKIIKTTKAPKATKAVKAPKVDTKKGVASIKAALSVVTTVKDGLPSAKSLAEKKLRLLVNPKETNHKAGSERMKALEFIGKAGKAGAPFSAFVENFDGKMVKWFIRDKKVAIIA
jgi:hypothetical protein